MKKINFIMFIMIAGLMNYTYAQEPVKYAHNRLIAQFENNTDISVSENGFITIKDESAAARFFNLEVAGIERLIKSRSDKFRINEPVLIHFDNNIDVEFMVLQLTKTGVFKFVEPDYIGHGAAVCAYTPNDTYFEERQWGLYNDGTFNSNSTVDADIDMDNGWSITKGSSSITVGILDSGVNPDHPEFAGRLWNNGNEIPGNNIDDDDNGYIDDIIGWDFANNDNDPTDDHGHGTNVGGIIGANGDNNLGYAGVDWNCKLLNAKILDDNNSGYYSWWIDAIYYAVDNGADVINMSVGGSSYSEGMATAANYAYTNNVPIVACMMNADNSTTYYPAGFENVISVGATDTDNQRVSPFFWGGGSNFGDHIDLCAPGNYIYGLSAFSNTNYNSYWGGTSQATPLVTGVIALIKGMDNTLSVDSIRMLLIEGAVDTVGDPSEDVLGWDQYHGHGLLNAYNTLLLTNMGTDVHIECDSLIWIDGNTYTSSNNTAMWTVTNDEGCDSLVILDLTINSNTGVDILAACDSLTWIDGITYTESNDTATWTLPNAAGCDSVVTLNLTISYPSTGTDLITACDSLTWIDGITYTSSNDTATWLLTSEGGCDSLVTLNLIVNYSNTGIDVITACDSLTWIDGNTYTSSNDTATWVLQNTAGCDSLVTLDLTIVTIDSSVTQNGNTLTADLAGAAYQWLDCDNEMNSLEGETNQSFTASFNGSYAVQITLNDCVDTSSCYSITSVGVIENDFGNKLLVFPNPTNGNVNIDPGEVFTTLQAKIFNVYGELISVEEFKNSEKINIQIKGVPGFYFVEIITEDNQKAVIRVLKQ